MNREASEYREVIVPSLIPSQHLFRQLFYSPSPQRRQQIEHWLPLFDRSNNHSGLLRELEIHQLWLEALVKKNTSLMS
jgi:hypothetical protein